MPQLWCWDSAPSSLLTQHWLRHKPSLTKALGTGCPLRRKQTRSCLLLTRQTDQHGAHGEIYHQLAMLRATGHKEGDDDLSWDVELEGVGEEDADGVQQLNWLVQPAERIETHSEPAVHTHTPSSESARWPCGDLAISLQVTNACLLWMSNFRSRDLSYRYTCTCTHKLTVKIFRCSSKSERLKRVPMLIGRVK